jgi:hypothetical protein
MTKRLDICIHPESVRQSDIMAWRQWTDGEYLLFLLKEFRDFILDLVENSAHGTKCHKSETFERMKVAMPEINEQIEIYA